MKVHKGRALVAAAAAIVLGLTACSTSSSGGGGSTDTSGTKGTGNLSDCGSAPTTCNSGKTKQGGSLTYVLEKTIPGWNQVFTNSNVFEVAEVEDGILPGVYLAGSDLKPFLNTDLMVSAEQTKTDPQTLVYKIKPTAVWNDGTPINFDDFKYLKDASDGTTCPKCGASSSAGYNQIASMTGSDNGKTVTVVMKTPFADWQSMFGALLPAHIAAKNGGTDGASINTSFQWFDKNVPTYSGGPYVITNYQKDTSITETPNPKWYGATKPSLDKLIFRILTDQTQEVPALKNNEVQVIYPQPSKDLVDQANGISNVQTYLGKGLNWEHLDLNTKNQFLSVKQLRLAIFTAIDRKAIIERGVGQFVPGIQPLGNRLLLPGQPGYQDNVTDGQGSGDLDKAKQILTSAGYTGVGSSLKTKDGKSVSFRCTYSAGNTLRQQTCQVVQQEMKELGIDLKLVAVPDLSILDKHDFDMIIFAWVGTPFVTVGNYQIFDSTQASNYTQNKDPQVDQLLTSALTETDQSKIPTIMNQADKLLEADAVSLPLFQKPTFIAAQTNLVNIRDNATSVGPPYNVETWGLKA